jgi:Anti-sigma-K factor rskA, C-terminal
LALVAEVGRPRADVVLDSGDAVSPDSIGPITPPATRASRRRFALIALGAAAVFALLAAGSFVAADMQNQLDQARVEAAHLHDLYAEIETLLQQPTARLVALQNESGAPAGALVLDPTSNQIAVLSDDLPPPPSGMEYRCWVEADGQRQAVGRMWFESGLAYWAGKNDGIAAWPAGSSFGVSLEEADQPASGPAVLSGKL